MPRGQTKIPIPPPYMGLRTDLVPWMQPIETMIDGQNVVIRDHKLYVRSGFRRMDDDGFGERVTGGHYWKTASGSDRTVAGGLTSRKQFTDGAWADITGTTWTGGAANQSRFTEFTTGDEVVLIGVNGVDTPIIWDGNEATDSDLGGGAPIAADVTAVANRVVFGNVTTGGNPYPSSFMFSSFNDPTTTRASDLITVGEAAGQIKAVRNIGVQSFAVYCEKAQAVATLTGGVTTFRVDFRSGRPGPPSAAAVVSAAGEVHYWLGTDGNFYRFDGGQTTCIGDAVRTPVAASLSTDYMKYTHGVYDRQNRECHWFWPSRGMETVQAGITYSIDKEIWSPLHYYSRDITASFEWEDLATLTWLDLAEYDTWSHLGEIFPTWVSMGSGHRAVQIIGTSGGMTYILGGEASDDGDGIDAYWVYPAKAFCGDGQLVRVDCFEAYFKQLAASMDLDIYLGTADRPGGAISYEDAQSFDMATSSTAEAEYVDVNSRFVTVKCRVTGSNRGLEFLGGLYYLYPRNVAS